MGDVRALEQHRPQEALDDLRDRLRSTRWPDAETLGMPGGPVDWSKGPPLVEVADLVRAQLTARAGFSARFYWESFPSDDAGMAPVPAAVTIFPAVVEKVPKPLLKVRFSDLRSFRPAAQGGHFLMHEMPELYANELRRGLGPLPW